MNNIVLAVLLAAVPTIIAITFHEAAHGYAANALGDDTAKRMGRLSLNPLRHVDRVGTILLPGILIVSQLLTIGRIVFLFGWAKPVPVSAWRFDNPRRGMMLVAIAGPLMNFGLAFLAALLLHVTDLFTGPAGAYGEEVLDLFLVVNLVLGLFNLLPIPPLDGGRVVVGLLPERLAFQYAKLERAGLVLVIVFVVVLPRVLREFGIEFDPVGDVLIRTVTWADHAVRVLAGTHD